MKKAKFFNKKAAEIKTSLNVDEELKARLSLVVMTATKDALPELKTFSSRAEAWSDLEKIIKKLRGEEE